LASEIFWRIKLTPALVSVGLVKQNRESRTLLCVSQYVVLEEIIEFLCKECCANDKNF